MEENVLKNFETFLEYPDKYLKVGKNSNLYYIKNDNQTYIARENIDSLFYQEPNLFSCEKSYYDVIDGKKVLTIKPYTLKNNKSRVILLNSLLDNNTELYLGLSDIEKLINSNQKRKEKIKTKR